MAHTLDVDRFNKAKAMHAKLTSPPTLQELCMNLYVVNAGALVSEWKKSGENFFDLFPNNLKTDLLKYYLSVSEAHNFDHFNASMEPPVKFLFYGLIYMLMNNTTLTIDFQDFTRSSWRYISVDELREILTNAAAKCPKLEHLVVEGEKLDEEGFTEGENAILPGSGINHLLQLENLRHLQISGIWYWKDDGLSQLFSHLKKLVFLRLMLHESVTVSGFKNIHLLEDLEQFHFELFSDEDEGTDSTVFEWVYSYCAENVPSLKLIGGYTEERNTDGILGIFRDNFSDMTNITPRITGTSMLEYLQLWTLPRANFPNLRHLYFRGPISMNFEKFHQKLSSFTKLNDLNLAYLTFNDVVEVLELVGEQLVNFKVYVEDKMDFFQVLHLCPNLETFKQQQIYFRVNTTYEVIHQSKYQPLVTKHNVRLLKKVELVFDGKGTNGLLELILFAPLLENLKFHDASISKAVCQMVQELQDVPEGNFPRLSVLCLYNLDLDLFCSMNDFDLFVQCLVCSAPRLRVCIISWNWRMNGHLPPLSDQWYAEQIVAQSYLQLLRH